MIRIVARALAGLVLVLAATAVVAPSPAAADPPGEWPDCYTRAYNTTFAYNYPAGGYNVYGGPWQDYKDGQAMVSPSSDCDDINVEVFSSGDFIVRTMFCPKPGNAYQFSCYSMGWGTVTTSIDWGVSAHWYHYPCDNWDAACDF